MTHDSVDVFFCTIYTDVQSAVLASFLVQLFDGSPYFPITIHPINLRALGIPINLGCPLVWLVSSLGTVRCCSAPIPGAQVLLASLLEAAQEESRVGATQPLGGGRLEGPEGAGQETDVLGLVGSNHIISYPRDPRHTFSEGTTGPSWHLQNSAEHITVPEKVLGSLGIYIHQPILYTL